MATGDLTASTPVYCDAGSAAAITTAINALNLASAADFIACVPVANGQQVAVFKIERGW